MFEKLAIKITLFAAAVVTIYSLFNFESLTKTATSLIITIIVFFVLGMFVQSYLEDSIKVEEPNEDETDGLNEENEVNELSES